MVNPDIDPPEISRQVVDAVGYRAAQFPDQEVMDPDLSGLPCGRYSRPGLRKSPTSSFFLVSTEITGCCSARAAATWVLMWPNCASRSGWLSPSLVLRLPCRL